MDLDGIPSNHVYPEGWTPEERVYARNLWEWDWGIATHGKMLHHAASLTFQSDYGETSGEAVTSCGRKLWLMIPGIFTRMGAPRCDKCCDALGYPRGIGSPKNDDRIEVEVA